MPITSNYDDALHADQPHRIRVLVVDDHELIRMGIGLLIASCDELQLVGEAIDFEQALQLTEQYKPDVILLDLHLDEGLIVNRIPELVEDNLDRKILIITALKDSRLHCLALRKGAAGVISKSEYRATFVKAIRCVHGGDLWIDRKTAAALFNDYS